MNWNDLTVNPRFLFRYFADVPSLQDVEIFRVGLSRDPSTIEIVFEPSAVLARATNEWPVDANAAQITLRLSGISSLIFNGWANNMFGNLIVTQVSDLIAVTFVGDVIFEAECSCIEVTDVVGYRDARRSSEVAA